MAGPAFNLARIKEEARSDKAEIRGKAMQELLLRAQQDSGVHGAALPIFQNVLRTEQDTWTTLNAVRGIELISGPDEARLVRLSLFNHSRPEVVAKLVLTISDPSYAPALIDLLSRRTEINIRVACIRTLGRLRGEAMLPAIVSYRDVPELRPHVVETLGDFGDLRAIPYLEPLLNDTTPAWEEDNHGPILRVCDLAGAVIKRLQTPPAQVGGVMRLQDAQGRQVQISREEWRTKVLPANLQKVWGNPDQLFGMIVSAINDGFRPDIVGASQHLYEIDPDRVRASNLWAIILIEEGRLDEAENVLRAFNESHGEHGVILANMGKVSLRRKDFAKAEEQIWHALELIPNQESGVVLYEALQRDQHGNEAGREAVRRIAALPGSWRAQVWLAREALAAGDVEHALAYYKEGLANCPRPVPTDLLIEMSGDLGNNARAAELIVLTEPCFDARIHGLEVGNNLIKAHLGLGQVDAAKTVMDQLRALNRPDWQESLRYWDIQVSKARGGSDALPTRASPPRLNFQATTPALPVTNAPAWRRLAPFAPLLAAAFDFFWVVLIILIGLGPGTHSGGNSYTLVMRIVCIIPALAGLLAGILVIARGLVRRRAEWIFLIIGFLACGLSILSFGCELYT